MRVTWTEHLRGSTLKLMFSVTCKDTDKVIITEPINIHDLAFVRFKFIFDNYHEIEPYVTYKKHEMAKKNTVNIIVSLETWETQCLCADDWFEYEHMKTLSVCDKEIKSMYKMYLFTFEVTISAHSLTNTSVNDRLYEDTKCTDFHFKATDGTVAVHKAILAVHSDVFLTMLNGEWKETADGQAAIEGVTVQTLQDLKKYMYLSTLPNDCHQLQKLLLVARCYLVDNLKEHCIIKLAEAVTPENFDAFIEFAVQNNLPELIKAIVIYVPDTIVNGIRQMAINEKAPKELTE